MDNAYLVAGLGNPGEVYARTRHNAGFLVVDRLAERWRVSLRMEKRFKARVAGASLNGLRIWLCQPQTFMNLSGEALRAVMDYYQVPGGNVLVVADDADLPLGELRLRPKGGCGGHHGLESAQAHLGTAEFARLRVGIGRQAAGPRQLAGHVLAPFAPAEWQWMEQVLDRAADQVETWARTGIQAAMNKFNGAVDRPGTEKDAE